MKQMKKFIFILLFIAVVFSVNLTANATQYDLPPGFLIGDQDGIAVSVNGLYFINAEGLFPGDVITKTLTLRNTEQGQPYKITMTAEPLSTKGPAKLLDNVHLELKLDDTILYSGRVRGDEGVNMIANALDLGTYATGDSHVLYITMTVAKDTVLTEELSESIFRWHFYAVKDEKADPPNTGVYIQYGLYAAVGGMLLVSGALLVKKKIDSAKSEKS